MAEILISVVAKKVMEYLVEYLIEYLGESTVQQGRYLFCQRKIIKNLEDQKMQLTSRKDHVLNRAEEANKKTEKVEKAVESWLNEVTNLLAEVERLQMEMNENNSCCPGWIPSRRRYYLCREMEDKTKMMKKLYDCKFESRNFTYFESTQLAYNQLLEAIKDDDSYMIGLFGMGGCGKTALVKEMQKKAKELDLFDRVAFTTVTQTPNIRKIQGEIVDLLGLKLDEETEAGRAKRISLKLQSGERILVILDDVWAKLNLEDIGIPFSENPGPCKVILTTRRQQVCELMDCSRRIPLDLLSESEAMTLFQRYAKTDIGPSSSSLNELERRIVRQCKGLPLAIEVVGTSLREKSIDDWKIAQYRLEHSKPIDTEPGVEDVFACLKLSYDFLQKRLAQSILLVCSMFPEDHEILIEDLFRCVVGTDLCGDFQSFDMARRQVKSSINMLIDSSLLMYPQVRMDHVKLHDSVTDWDLTLTTQNQEEDGLAVWWDDERKDRVKMHDMIRDMALWIASREDHTMMLNTVRDLKEKATDCFGVSLRDKEIAELSNQIIAPKLQILLMHSENSLELPNAFFEGSERLKVMAIIRESAMPQFLSLPHSIHMMTIKGESRMPPSLSLPYSIHTWTNLGVLRLVKWEFRDISFVESLVNLEVLDLSGSHLMCVPNGIQKLMKLKLLDLSCCKIDFDFESSKVIAECQHLEELYAFGSNIFSSVEHCHKCFGGGSSFPKLQRYSLEIGGCDYNLQIALSHSSCTKFLRISNISIYSKLPILCDLLQRSEEAIIDDVNREVDIDWQVFFSRMNELTFFQRNRCTKVRCLINDDPKCDEFLPNLDTIVLSDIAEMNDFCFGPPPLGFFEKLKRVQISECGLRITFPQESNLCNLMELTISSCARLKWLFTLYTAKSVVQLQQLTIQGCHELEEIIAFGDRAVDSDSGFLFPKLRILSVDSCDKLKYVLPVSGVEGFLQLESLSIKKSSGLQCVFSARPSSVIQLKLPVLKLLRLEHLPNLVRISPNWPSLNLVYKECPSLTLPHSISAIQN